MTGNDNQTDGITRDRYASPTVTIETCHAIRFYFQPGPDGSERVAIVWRDSPSRVRPVESGKRLRDLRPGDRVLFNGNEETLIAVEIYR